MPRKSKKADELQKAQEILSEAALDASEKARDLMAQAQDNTELMPKAIEAMELAEKAIKVAKDMVEHVDDKHIPVAPSGLSEKMVIKARENNEKARRATYQKKIDEQMKDTIKCKVQNLEDPGKNVSIEFTYEGHSFAMYDGMEYDLPRIVVKHLNNVKTPIHKMIQDPDAPKDNPSIIKQIVGFKHRFSAVPTDMGV